MSRHRHRRRKRPESSLPSPPEAEAKHVSQPKAATENCKKRQADYPGDSESLATAGPQVEPQSPALAPWRGQIEIADGKRLDVALENALILTDEAEAGQRFKLDEPHPVAIEAEARKAGYDGIIYRSPALVIVLDGSRATPVPEPEPRPDWMTLLLARAN